MDDLDLANDRGGVGGDEEAAEMVDDEFVAAWGEGEKRLCVGKRATHHWDRNLS